MRVQSEHGRASIAELEGRVRRGDYGNGERVTFRGEIAANGRLGDCVCKPFNCNGINAEWQNVVNQKTHNMLL